MVGELLLSEEGVIEFGSKGVSGGGKGIYVGGVVLDEAVLVMC